MVCFDETSTQLLADPGRPSQCNRDNRYEFARCRTRNIFLTCEGILALAWRHVAITELDIAYPGPSPSYGRTFPASAHRQAAGISPHAQARQLAELC